MFESSGNVIPFEAGLDESGAPISLAHWVRTAPALALTVKPTKTSTGVALASALDKAFWEQAAGEDFLTAAKREKISPKAGSVHRISGWGEPGTEGYRPILFLVGTGEGKDADLRRAGAGLARSAKGHDHLPTTLGQTKPALLPSVVQGLMLGSYRPTLWGAKADKAGALPTFALIGSHDQAAIDAAGLGAEATLLARYIADMPSNLKSPMWVAEQVLRRASESDVAGSGLRVELIEEPQLDAEGFGGITTVGYGSERPPVLVRIDYPGQGAGARRKPIVLVGKGITYDTGGISLKPNDAMLPMRTDVSGAATVFGAIMAVAKARAKQPVVVLLPLAENMISGSAYRPSDVITMYGGKTVEIGNTDAEGRLVLADALHYAVTELKPEAVVDVATLTGAMTLGLGRNHGGLFTDEAKLTKQLQQAAAKSGERIWPMPLESDYEPSLKSEIADVRQDPRGGFGAGASTAALFLKTFVGKTPWAHFDIAGVGRGEKDEFETCKGATGWGARLLYTWLVSR